MYYYALERTNDSNSTYYVYNGHGDVAQLANYVGGITKNYTYDAFGNEVSPTAGDTNPFRYCGEYFDTQSGTYYLRARYYNPSTGRFTTEDPIRDGLNWYAYCAGNPVTFNDPSGQFLGTVFDIVSLGFSIWDVWKDPKDIGAWLGLAGDIVDLLPVVSGVGEGIKVVGKTRKAVTGLISDGIELIGDSKKLVKSADKADAIVKSLKTIDDVGERAKLIKDGAYLMSYKKLKELAEGTGLEVHHLIEKRFADILGINADDILSIAIDKETHKRITKAFRKLIHYNLKDMRNAKENIIYTGTAVAQDIWNALVEVYIQEKMEYLIPYLKEFFKNAETPVDFGGW